MVLVTCGGPEEKPGELRGTDRLLREKVRREQELWFAPKERRSGSGRCFHGYVITLLWGVGRVTRLPHRPTPHLIFGYQKHNRPRRGWLLLPNTHSQGAQICDLFLPCCRQALLVILFARTRLLGNYGWD